MIANIISKHSYTLTDVIKTSEYEFNFDGDHDGKSQIAFHRRPKAEEDDFIIVMDGKNIAFQGIVSKIENEEDSSSYTVTAREMQALFDRKVILTNESIKKNAGIEDFIADQITRNFINSDDTILDIDYLRVTAKTHTPVAAGVPNESGIYNLKTYIGNAMTNYGVFVDFEFKADSLEVYIEKKEQDILQIDATLPSVLNLSETVDVQAMTKLTVLWQPPEENANMAKRHFFLRTDRTITEDKSDVNRAKGTSDIVTSAAETEDAMIQEAYDKFTGNSYNHKITFDVLSTDMHIGQKCKIKTKNGVRESIISAMTRSSDSELTNVTLGKLKVTLIEKLKGVEIK